MSCAHRSRRASAQLNAYLDAMGRFHAYSFNNVMLILSQQPDATRVAGFRMWKSLGRSVKKGEKGIAIFAPMRVKEKQESENADEEDASRVIFRVVHVFDVAQTEGEPLPEPVRVGGDPGEYLDRLCEAVVTSGITLETSFELGAADGVSKGGSIALRPGLSRAEYFSVLVHEWAHELLHQKDGETRPDRVVRETEAEAVAFVVGRSIGLETSSAASDYIRMYSGDKETLLASLGRVQSTACRIIESISEPVVQPKGISVMASWYLESFSNTARTRMRPPRRPSL